MNKDEIDFNFYNLKAKDSLIKHLSNVDGKKIMILEDPLVYRLIFYLLSPEEVQKFLSLNFTWLSSFENETQNDIVFVLILKPKRDTIPRALNAISKYVKKHEDSIKTLRENSEYSASTTLKKACNKHKMLFLTQKPYNFESQLEKQNIQNYISFEELNINLVSLDYNTLSMEMELRDCFDDLYFSKNYSTTIYQKIARAINDIERRYGSFSNVHLHGDSAKAIFKIVNKKQVNKTESKFDHLILIDRKVDFVTPFCLQLNYEGLIDSIFGIKYCKIHIENSPNNSAKTKNQNEKTTDNCVTLNKLSSKNQFYHNKLRYEEISKLAIDAGKNREERTIFKTYIDPVLDKKILRKEIQLTTEQMAEWSRGKVLDANEERVKHIHVFGKILSSNINYFIKFQSKILSDTFSKYDMRKIISGDLGEVKLGKKDFDQVLSFLILFYSKYKHSSKQKNKDFLSELEELFIKEYSPSQFLFDNLKRIGLYENNENLKDMKRLQKLNDCFEKEFIKFFDRNYSPIMCQSISKILFTNRNNPEEVSGLEDIFPEEYEYITRYSNPSSQISPSNKKKNVLIFFIGGCTYNEIATFNILEKTQGFKFYFVTTGFINAKTIIEVLSHTFTKTSPISDEDDDYDMNNNSVEKFALNNFESQGKLENSQNTTVVKSIKPAYINVYKGDDEINTTNNNGQHVKTDSANNNFKGKFGAFKEVSKNPGTSQIASSSSNVNDEDAIIAYDENKNLEENKANSRLDNFKNQMENKATGVKAVLKNAVSNNTELNKPQKRNVRDFFKKVKNKLK